MTGKVNKMLKELFEKVSLILIICTSAWIPFHAINSGKFEYYGSIIILILGIIIYCYTSYFENES